MIAINTKQFVLALSILTTIVVSSCRKDKPENTPTYSSTSTGEGVFIINEGNFQGGNAKLSYYDISTGIVSPNVFESTNGVALGDVGQSMYIHNSKGYIVVNNSGKIEVIDPLNFNRLGTINGLTSPRHFLPVSKSKAYVTDLFSNSIQVIDLNTNTVSKSILSGGHTEELTLIYGKAFVTCPGKDLVYIVNTSTDALEDSIAVGVGPNSIKEDKNGKLWVLCGGNFTDTAGSLQRINPNTRLVETSISFSNATMWPSKLELNKSLDSIYFLNTDVYKMSINDGAIPDSSFIKAGTRSFYGLGINPRTGNIFIADAIDYIQKGKVYRYNTNGEMINSFSVSIIPADFCFD